MPKLMDFRNAKEVLPGKKEYTDMCFCDCIPCKTDSCDKCELSVASKFTMRNGDMCHEGNDSEYVDPFNAAIDAYNNVRIEGDVEDLGKHLLTLSGDEDFIIAGDVNKLAKQIIASMPTWVVVRKDK